MKKGFTLAEVLITLGIIGVVASMTIPTLITNNQQRSLDTAANIFNRKLGSSGWSYTRAWHVNICRKRGHKASF